MNIEVTELLKAPIWNSYIPDSQLRAVRKMALKQKKWMNQSLTSENPFIEHSAI